MKNAIIPQVVEKMNLVKPLGIQRPAIQLSHLGQKHAQSCTLTAGHYFASRKSKADLTLPSGL
jgi:hypothetical protein